MSSIDSVGSSSQSPKNQSLSAKSVTPVVNQSFLSKRVQSIVGNDKVFEGYPLGALEHLAKYVGENTSVSRRSLRANLEAELVEHHGKFVSEYETRVSGYLERNLNCLEIIDRQLTDNIDQLLGNRDRIGSVMSRTSVATRELEEREHKLDVLIKFKKLFVVDLEEADRAIESGELSKVLQYAEDLEKVRRNCQVLMRGVPNGTLAVESLSVSVEVLERVYERVFQGVSKSPDSSMNLLRKSLVLLQERPHLFHEALTGICQVRCDSHASGFLHVLTRGDDGLELSTFDSVKFLSDMLSWVLDCSLAEKEFVDSLVEHVRPLTWAASPVKPKLEYLDLSVSGVMELVESRFSSIVKSTFGILELFKLSRVLTFYSEKLRFVGGPSAKDAMASMHHAAWSSFLSQWESRAQNERSAPLLTRSGLSPLPFVIETVYLLESILSIQADSAAGEDEEDIFLVLSAGIDPLIQTCFQVAGSTGMNGAESCVFLLNCLATLQGPLKRHAFAAETVKVIASLMDMQMETLVVETRSIVLEKTGLGETLDSLSGEYHPLAVSSSLKSFYALLFTQGIAAAGHTDSLISRELRAEARHAIGKSIADAYETVYTATSSLGVATHTPEQVRTLLDV
jgi:hypothetical protein